MASENTIAHNVPTATGTVIDDAGGVAESHWFVAIVNHNNELNVHRRLTAMGYDSYVASQQEMRERRNGRRVKVDRLVIPSKVFIRCTEKERRQIVTLPFINRFMTDIACRPGEMLRRPMVVIPDREMRVMQFMLGYSDSPSASSPPHWPKAPKLKSSEAASKDCAASSAKPPTAQTP